MTPEQFCQVSFFMQSIPTKTNKGKMNKVHKAIHSGKTLGRRNQESKTAVARMLGAMTNGNSGIAQN